MFRLNDKTKIAIQKYTGKSVAELEQMDEQEIIEAVEKKINKELTFPKKIDKRLPGRGSVFLFFNRFIRMDFVNKRLAKIAQS